MFSFHMVQEICEPFDQFKLISFSAIIRIYIMIKWQNSSLKNGVHVSTNFKVKTHWYVGHSVSHCTLYLKDKKFVQIKLSENLNL